MMGHPDRKRVMNRREILLRIATFTAGAALPAAAHARMNAEAKIHTRAIPSSGEHLPVIGLGTWQTFDVGSSASARAPLREVLEAFASLGGRVVDSSPMYGRSEEVVGDLKAGLAEGSKLFIATKVWTTGKAAGIRQMEESLRKLRVKAIDLMQVHNLLDVDTHLDTLDRWKAEGRVRYTGVTHYTASGAEEIARVIERRRVDFVQINYSVAERAAEKRLLPLARERGIAVIANRPFAGGEMFARLRGKPLPRWAGDIDCTTWAQLMLKFVVSHPALTCAIPASAKVEHTRDNMRAGYGRMPDERIREAIVESIAAA
jgi:diketogulonate reductase-like aldo/keto reductase